MSTNINSFFIIQLFVFMDREKIINQKYNYAYASERGRKITKARKKKRNGAFSATEQGWLHALQQDQQQWELLFRYW